MLRTLTRSPTVVRSLAKSRTIVFTPTKLRTFSTCRTQKQSNTEPTLEELVTFKKRFQTATMIARGLVAVAAGYAIHEWYKGRVNMQKYVDEAEVFSKQYPFITTVIALNLLQFVPYRSKFFKRHLQLSVENIMAGRIHTIVTSMFAHERSISTLGNIALLYAVSDLEWSMGTERFGALYMTSGVVAGLVQLAYMRARGITGATCGAYRAIMGAICAYGLYEPFKRVPQSSEKPTLNVEINTIVLYLFLYNLVCMFRPLNQPMHIGNIAGGITGFGMYWLMAREQSKRFVKLEHPKFVYQGEVTGLNTMEGIGTLTKNTGEIYFGMFDGGEFKKGSLTVGTTRLEQGEFSAGALVKGAKFVNNKKESEGEYKWNFNS